MNGLTPYSPSVSSLPAMPHITIQEDPVASLARSDPVAASGILHRLVSLEHRKLASLERTAMVQAQASVALGLAGVCATWLQTRPHETAIDVEYSGFVADARFFSSTGVYHRARMSVRTR
jgi:hypothetical protein